MYTLLLPIFKHVVNLGKITTLRDLRVKTIRYIEEEELFDDLDFYGLIYKYSVYYIEDF